MFKKLRGMFSNDLSIDLGTANTLIYVKDPNPKPQTPNPKPQNKAFKDLITKNKAAKHVKLGV